MAFVIPKFSKNELKMARKQRRALHSSKTQVVTDFIN